MFIFLLLQTTLASNLVPRALFPGFGAMEKRPGDEVALASFDRSECRGTEVRDQTEIAWYCPQFSMGNSFPNMSVTELWILVFDSVFWGVSSTEVVLFPVNSSTRKKLRLLCVGVTFVISSSRYERTKTLGKFVILTNEVHKRRNENQSPWQICRKKLLGVTFDEHLKFTSHLKELSKRVSRKIGVMMRLKNVIPTLAKVRIYKSLILPQITYCKTVWHLCRKSDGRVIETLQERALRSVVGFPSLGIWHIN